jgi:hypothetical protein
MRHCFACPSLTNEGIDRPLLPSKLGIGKELLQVKSHEVTMLALSLWAIISIEYSVSLAQDIKKYRPEEICEDSTFQISLGPMLSNLTCHCLIIQPNTGANFSTLYSFRFSSNSGRKITFSIADTISGWAGGPLYSFEDLNFDGYKDLKCMVDRSPSMGEPEWHAWILDPDSFSFFLSEAFSELPGDVTLDSLNKTIAYSGYAFHAIERVTWDRVYKVFGRDLLILQERQTTDFANDGESFSKPDSIRTEASTYQYDLSTRHPVLIELTENIEISKLGKRLITTTIKKRIGDQMTVSNKTERVLEDK